MLSGGFQRESFDIKSADDNMGRVAVQAWMSEPAARSLLGQMGHDFDQLKAQAVGRDFRPVALGAQVSFELQQQLREVWSRNVLAKLEGTTRSSEYVVYTGHWDHLGMDTSLTGDQIYNGAIDNASGMAAVIEIAEAFTKLSGRPDRSILFLAVTAEEQGLLGAKYYAENPLYPLANTVANVQRRRDQPVGAHRGHSRGGDGVIRRWTMRWRLRPSRRAGSSSPIRSRRRASSTGPTSSNSRSRACPRSSRTPARAMSARTRHTA